MAAQAFLLIASFLVVLFVLARPLGSGLARLINNVPLPGMGGVEKGIWRVLGIDEREMNWRDYLIAILLLNIVGLIALFAMLMLQGVLPLNPQQFPYAFIVGFIFAFLVERTNSIFASILPHMIINGTTIFSIFATSSETVTTAAAELPQGSALASLLVVSLLSLPWLAVLLYLFLKANPPREELLLLDETGSPYRERFLSPAIITIFAIFIVFGLLPYVMA